MKLAWLIDNRSHCHSNATAMYICVCKAVSDRHIRAAVQDAGVISLRDLTRGLGLGTCCGKCVPAARAVLDQALQQPSSHERVAPSPIVAAAAFSS